MRTDPCKRDGRDLLSGQGQVIAVGEVNVGGVHIYDLGIGLQRRQLQPYSVASTARCDT